ncbi:hypothetical protein N7931_06965 [Catenovulum sp. 2E275]|uniref:hypothetical protein n=1 Tax=Catenovulum sp. 2E275 TaxID=2980497 RepID=UPI0021D31456|nr:hypothetical protein [Catenovulum sp. 2E275]MCU4675372.1 hypothetical protein [Catenovulum sp. 2E275]
MSNDNTNREAEKDNKIDKDLEELFLRIESPEYGNGIRKLFEADGEELMAINILSQWGASPEQIISVLPFDVDKVEMGRRIQIVRTLNTTLRNLLGNSKSISTFMTSTNESSYFSGCKPIDVFAEGGIETMEEVLKQLDDDKEIKFINSNTR